MKDINSDNLAFEDRTGLQGLFVPSVWVFWLDFLKKKLAEPRKNFY